MPTTRHSNNNHTNTLNFNVIVTFVISEKVLSGLHDKELLTGYSKDCVGLFQVMFDLDISFYKTSTYDSIMRRVKRQVVRQCAEWFWLSEDEMEKISTAANWQRWEKLTGNKYAAAASDSSVSTDGKFYLSNNWWSAA